LINGDADPLVKYRGGVIWPAGVAEGIGAKRTRNYFARQYGCEPIWSAVHSNPNPSDQTAVTTWTAALCNGRPVRVTLIQVHGGGHTWPNQRDLGPLWSLFAGLTSRDFDGASTIGHWFLE
jgi:poly(3-hydroxybutyrate) depolymerase